MNSFLSILFSIVMLFNFVTTGEIIVDSESTIGVIENTNVSGVIIEEPTNLVPEIFSYSIYIPNSNADGFDTEIVSVNEISSDAVLDELKNYKVLPADVSINNLGIKNGLITIDFNQSFADVVRSMGTSGETMIVGSVVNTFLNAFQAEIVFLTVNGEILESGHAIYDFELGFFEL